ncbi:MAG: hypothetical protein EBU90_10355 [Proteobacteria bacterium]|nr:hypothetical protein [Pseudomonadota bacterium]NBP14136.1 hypothetical protein [bacterium]
MILSKNQLVDSINQILPDNNTGRISPKDLRESLINILDSLPNILITTNLNTANFATVENRTTKAGENTLSRSTSTVNYLSEDNSAFGYSALASNYQSRFNTAIGSFAMSCNLYGSKNTAIGYNALPSVIDGIGNVSIGNYSLYLNKNKNYNIALGHAAGYHLNKLPEIEQNYNLFVSSYNIDYDDMCGSSGNSRTDLRPLLFGKLLSSNLKLAIAPTVTTTGISLHDEAVLQVGGNIGPTTSGRLDINNDQSIALFDLGSRNYWWRSLYIDKSIELINDLSFNKPPLFQNDDNRTSLFISKDGYIGLNTTNLHRSEGFITSKGSIIPEADNFYDLGSPAHAWRNAIVNNLVIQNSILLPQLKRFYLSSNIDNNGNAQGLFSDDLINKAGLYLKSKDYWYDREYSISYLAPTESIDTPDVKKPALLINFNQNISDFSDNNHTVANINSSLSNAHYKSNNQSLYLNGSGRQGIQTNISSKFAFGINDFTIDFWIRPDSLPSSTDVYRFLLDMRPTNANGAYVLLYLLSDGRVQYSSNLDTNNIVTLTTSSTQVVSVLSWNHIAISRISGLLKIFINGVLAGSVNDSTEYLSQAFRFGHTNWTSTHYNINNYVGYVDDIRIVNGVGIFNSNFDKNNVTLTNVALTKNFNRDASWLSNISLRINNQGFLKTRKILGYENGLDLSTSGNTLSLNNSALIYKPTNSLNAPSSGVYSSFISKSEDQYNQIIEYKNPSSNGRITQQLVTNYNNNNQGVQLQYSRDDRTLDINFIDSDVVNTVASFSKDKVTFIKGESQFDIFDLVVEGYAKSNIDAPISADFPTSGILILKNSRWINKKEIPLINRDASLDINKGHYIVAASINGEYRPVWVSCDETDIGQVIPSGLNEQFLIKVSNMYLQYIREDRIVSDTITPDQEGVVLKLGNANLNYLRQDVSPNPNVKDTFAVFGRVSSGTYTGTEGYFYPVSKEQTQVVGQSPLQFRFEEFPNQLFYMSTGNQNIGVGTDGNYTVYTEGRVPTYFELGVVVQENSTSLDNYVAAQQPIQIGGSDFTLEFMIRPQDTTFSRLRYLYDSRPNNLLNSTAISNGVYHSLVLTTQRELLYNIVDSNGLRINKISTPTGVLNPNAWQHVAISRKDKTTRLFVNGIQRGPSFIDEYEYSSSIPVFFNSLTKTPFDFDSNNLQGLLLPSVITRVDGFYGHADDILLVNSGLYNSNFTPQSLQARSAQLNPALSGIRISLVNGSISDTLNNRSLTFPNVSIVNDIVNPTAGNTGPSLFISNSGNITTARSSYPYNLNNSRRIYISDARAAQNNNETLSHYTFIDGLDPSRSHKITDIFTLNKPLDINIVGASFATPVVSGIPTTILVQVGASIPNAPAGLLVTKGNQRVVLSWTAPFTENLPILDYDIQYSSNSGLTWTTFVKPTSTQTTATVTSLTNGTSYIFRVAAINRIGQSEYSIPSIPVTPSISSPEQPTNLVAQGTNASLVLSWTAPESNGGANISNYSVQYSTNSGLTYTTVTTNSTNNTFTLLNLVNGTDYTVRVAAINSIGVGIYSQTVIGRPVNQLPSEPRNLNITRTNFRELTINWLPPIFTGGSNINRYNISYAINNDSVYNTIFASGDTNSLSIPNLLLASGYVFKVSAENTFGTGISTALSDSILISSGVIPSVPLNLLGTSSNRSVSLSWNPPANDGGGTISDYTIQYRQISKPNDSYPFFDSSTITFNEGVSTSTSSIVTSLQNGAAYKFKVSAKNYVGNSPFTSETIDITPSRIPYAPQSASGFYIFNNGNVSNFKTDRVILRWNIPISGFMPTPSSPLGDPGNGGAIITDYLISYSGIKNNSYSSVYNFNTQSVDSFAIITNLDTTFDWYFNIRAINKNGLGDISTRVSGQIY